MDTIAARLSRTGSVLCGRPSEDGRYHCDAPLAAIVTRTEGGTAPPTRRLVPLPGWRLDPKGVWQKTTRVEDLRAQGRAIGHDALVRSPGFPHLPALARCPKCRTVQWLDPERLLHAPSAPGGRVARGTGQADPFRFAHGRNAPRTTDPRWDRTRA